jgi:hypothetical protein
MTDLLLPEPGLSGTETAKLSFHVGQLSQAMLTIQATSAIEFPRFSDKSARIQRF